MHIQTLEIFLNLGILRKDSIVRGQVVHNIPEHCPQKQMIIYATSISKKEE